jgi:hypothetical protein
MEATMMFLDCPAYLDQNGAARCGLPAEVRCRFTMRSTGGPLESAMIRCPAGHWFSGPIESLIWQRPDKHHPGTAAVASTARRTRLTGRHHGRAGTGGPVIQHPAEPRQAIRRPNTAPAYYLGRPATAWITAMSPRRRGTAPNHLMQAVTSS